MTITTKTEKEIMPIQLVKNDLQREHAQDALIYCYSNLYPNVDVGSDPFNEKTDIELVSYDKDLKVTGTARVVLDSNKGLPDESLLAGHIESLRKRGKNLAEIGRFSILSKGPNLIKQFYKAFFLIGVEKGIDSFVFLIKEKDIAFHEKIIGGHILKTTHLETFGSNYNFCGCEWDVKNTSDKFFRWSTIQVRA